MQRVPLGSASDLYAFTSPAAKLLRQWDTHVLAADRGDFLIVPRDGKPERIRFWADVLARLKALELELTNVQPGVTP
jgi:hypothetical protein